MRLVVKVESAGKKECDLEGGGLAAAGKSLGTADPTSKQRGWSLFPGLCCLHGDALLKSEQATAASSAFGILAETRPALISTTGT